MGKTTTFEVLVDNEGAMVKVGDTLRGQLVLELCEDIQVKNVRISFTSKCSVQWAEARKVAPVTEVSSTMVDPVTAEEVYFSNLLRLFPQQTADRGDNQQNTETVTLTRGSHTFDFEFHVPRAVPSSFSGSYGNVRYILKAVLERPWKSGQSKVEVRTRCIKVLSELDLNYVCGVRGNVHLSDELKVNTLLLPSVDCLASMRLTRKGFTAGEAIPVDFSILNKSTHDIQQVTLHLKMIITYQTQRGRCMSERSLGRSILGKVPAQKTLEGVDTTLTIPDTCQPTGLPGCSMIDIRYQLDLKVKPGLLSLKRLKLKTDIIVGTRPLRVTTFQDSPPDYWSCCLPSYEDLMALFPQMIVPQPTDPVHTVIPQMGSSPLKGSMLHSLEETPISASWQDCSSVMGNEYTFPSSQIPSEEVMQAQGR